MDPSRIARVLRLTLKPVSTWDSVSQIIVVVLFLLGSPTVLGITISLGYGLAILGFLVAGLALRAAWRLQSDLDERDALAPKLSLGAPEVTDPVDVHTVIQMGSTPFHGGAENARFVRVPVVNEQGTMKRPGRSTRR